MLGDVLSSESTYDNSAMRKRWAERAGYLVVQLCYQRAYVSMIPEEPTYLANIVIASEWDVEPRVRKLIRKFHHFAGGHMARQ